MYFCPGLAQSAGLEGEILIWFCVKLVLVIKMPRKTSQGLLFNGYQFRRRRFNHCIMKTVTRCRNLLFRTSCTCAALSHASSMHCILPLLLRHRAFEAVFRACDRSLRICLSKINLEYNNVDETIYKFYRAVLFFFPIFSQLHHAFFATHFAPFCTCRDVVESTTT